MNLSEPSQASANDQPAPVAAPIRLAVAGRMVLMAGAFALFALPVQAQDIAAGKQKADEVCFACHGADGNTPLDPSYPKLAGQYQDYLEHALLDYSNDRRKNPLMGPQAKLLSREDIRNVAAYYASLPGTITNRR